MLLGLTKDEFDSELRHSIEYYYPFTTEQLFKYSDILNWTKISLNKNIDWSYEIVNEFQNYLDWNTLQQNSYVKKRMTLGVLFPTRVALPTCHCSFNYDFCECEDQHFYSGNWETLNHVQIDLKDTSDYVIEAVCQDVDEEYLLELLEINSY